MAEVVPNIYTNPNFDFSTSSLASCSKSNSDEVVVQKRTTKEDLHNPTKRKKIILLPNTSNATESFNTAPKEYIIMVVITLVSYCIFYSLYIAG